jgi:hypothetical protein
VYGSGVLHYKQSTCFHHTYWLRWEFTKSPITHIDTPESVHLCDITKEYDQLRMSTTSDIDCPTFIPDTHIHQPLPIFQDSMQWEYVEPVAPCPTTYTIEPSTIPPTDLTSTLTIASPSFGSPAEYVYQDPISVAYSSATITKQLSPNKKEQPNVDYIVRCPCCDEDMDIGHTCHLEDADVLDSANVSLLNASVTPTLVQSTPCLPSNDPPPPPDPPKPPTDPPPELGTLLTYFDQMMDQRTDKFLTQLAKSKR